MHKSRGLLSSIMIGWLLVVGGSLPGQAAPAKITALVLDVTHRIGASGVWQPSKVGTSLPAGSRVRTAKRSKCEIQFPDGSRVRVGPRSDLVISDPATNKVKVVTGQVLAHIVTGTGAQIQGASATAAIRGTWVLFQGPTAPGVHPRRICDSSSAWFGTSQFTNPQGTITMGHRQTSNACPATAPSEASPGLPWAFGSGSLYPWWSGWPSGTHTQSTPGTQPGMQFKNQQVTSRYQTQQFVQAPTHGSLDVIVQSAQATSPASSPSQSLPTSAMLAAASLSETIQAERLGRAFYGPLSQVDLVGLMYEGGALSGGWVRSAGIYEHYYGEIGIRALTDYDGDWDTAVSDLFVVNRNGRTDLVAGRQRYLEGPVNNSGLGSLFGTVHFDGISLRRQTDKHGMLLAWVDDYESWGQPPVRVGASLARLSTPFAGGQAAINALRQRGEDWGVSGDISYPAVPGYLDLYAEIGEDPLGRDFHTIGAYLPELYQSASVDLFVEHAGRDGFGHTWSAMAYWDGPDGWTGLAGFRRAQGQDCEFALGAIKRFGRLSF